MFRPWHSGCMFIRAISGQRMITADDMPWPSPYQEARQHTNIRRLRQRCMWPTTRALASRAVLCRIAPPPMRGAQAYTKWQHGSLESLQRIGPFARQHQPLDTTASHTSGWTYHASSAWEDLSSELLTIRQTDFVSTETT